MSKNFICSKFIKIIAGSVSDEKKSPPTECSERYGDNKNREVN